MTIAINYLAVIGAAVVSMVIGMAWYSPMLFAKPWMEGLGVTPEKLEAMKKQKGGMGKTYAMQFLASLVMAYVFAHFVQVWQVADAHGAWQLAFWTWLGFIATVQLGSVLWEQKTVKFYAINVAHYLITLYAMTLVLTYWR